MIEPSPIDEALNRLSHHFEARLIVRPPADTDSICRLESHVGRLPRSYALFLLTCNGLRVRLEETPEAAHISGIHEIELAWSQNPNPAIVNHLIPLRGDPDANCDWLCLGDEAARGAVVRWNPWTVDAEFISSSFDHFLDAWSRYLVRAFDGRGRPVRPPFRCPFDAHFVRQTDLALALLVARDDASRWLHELQMVAPSGDDME